MSIRPRLKAIHVHRADDQVVISHQSLSRAFIDDTTGAIAALLLILRDGEYTTDELPAVLAAHGHPVTSADIGAALAALDSLGVLESADGDDVLDAATRERHHSNLRFYDCFATLDRTSASFHQRVARSHVLLLGAGGLGSGILQSLVGLGMGEITLVDTDTVEMKNLARQFVYGLDAIGRPKVDAARDWVEAYSGGTRVSTVNERITDVASIVALGSGADIVVCAIDTPDDIHLLVNEACFALGVPYVVGGLSHSTLSYWSVEPGRTPCRRCLECHHDDERETLPVALRREPMIDPPPVNRATGPVVQLISGLMTMETMRYLTRTDPPIAAATYHVFELAGSMATSTARWNRHPGCPLCPQSGRVSEPGREKTGASR